MSMDADVDSAVARRRPTISVLMPVYNSAATVRQAIESVLAGDLLPLEIIVMDDCSTDQTPEILSDLATRSPLISVVRNETNQTLRGNLNRGLPLAQGDYVARLDHDDIWEPAHLSSLSRVIRDHPGLRLVSTGYNVVRDGQVIQTIQPQSITQLTWDNIIAHSSTCFHTVTMKEIGGYQDSFFQDYATWIKLVDEPSQYMSTGSVTVNIHVFPNSLSRIDRGKSLRERLKHQRAAVAKYGTCMPPIDRLRARAGLVVSRLRAR